MTIDNEIRAAVDNATAAAVRMLGEPNAAARSMMTARRTVIVPETPLDGARTVGNSRSLVSAATLADATYLADTAHAASKVRATFAVIAASGGFDVVPAWSVPTNAVLYRTGN
jgi:hypothetical protein